jgi:ATP-dependent Clp protease ATP-binding subunit ClpC
MKILDYFKKCRGQNLELNMRTLRNLMSKTEDIWPQLLTGEKIAALRGKLKERLLGQDFVINKLTETLIRVRHNIEEQRNSGKIDEKPLAYFFFAGPTGVGKTEVFRILSDELKGIRSKKINMPEYKEEHAVSRLFGAPPGYVGYGKGELGQFLLDNPASIILFDEFEKAHEKIWQNFLTMLEGSLTTGDGVKIDLSQTILFFTSNAGASDLVRIESNMSEGQQENIRRQNTQIVRNALRQSGAAPELIGRLLEAIMPFNHLTREVASGIIDLNLKKISEKLARSGYEIEFHPSVKDYMLAFYERERASGARAIANHIEGTLYGEILSRLSGG